jgi:ABC-type nitrate/sulfonate/bicarbonate transport system substrate-binding protein
MPRHLRIVASTAVIALMLTGCGGGGGGQGGSQAAPERTCADVDLTKPPAQPVPIRIGHGVASEEPFWLMKAMPKVTPNQGTWYSLDMKPFRGSEERLVAYQAGQLDAALVPPQVVLRGISRQLDVVPVASVMREGTEGFNTTFIALQGKGITGAADLKGKTIAIVDLGSHLDYAAKAAVKQGGFDFRADARYVVLPFPAQEEALRGGRIDVAGLPQPFYATAHAKGGVVDLFDAVDVTGFPFDLLTVVFDRKFLNDNTGAVCAWLADYQAAVSFYKEQPEQAKTAIVEAGFVKVPLPVYLKTSDYERPADGRVDVEGYRQLNDKMIEFGILQPNQKVDAAKLAVPGITAGTPGAPSSSGTTGNGASATPSPGGN